MAEKRDNFPEPVPAASQIGALTFLAGVEGYLKPESNGSKLRITMHRVMMRENEGYLQQICSYLGSEPLNQSSAGRMFPVQTGIMGRAFVNKKIVRTRRYESRDALVKDLAKDLKDNNDDRDPNTVPLSYLAIPLLAPTGTAVCTLYVECDELNFFASDARVEVLRNMCTGFCRLFDWLNQTHPFPTLRNFELEITSLNLGKATAFKRLQEDIELAPPQFNIVRSFNYDTSPA